MAILFPLLAVLIWAINAAVNKLSAGAIDPASISFYRWLLAWIVLTPFMLPKVIHNWERIRPYLGKLFILGLLGMALYQSLAYYAAYTISALSIGIFISLIPILTVLLSLLLLNNPPTQGICLGGVLSFIGIIWLISAGKPLQLFQFGMGRGELMMLIAAFAYALYGVLIKRWAMPISVWQSLYLQIMLAIVILTPSFLAVDDKSLNSNTVWLVIYAGIPASILATFFWVQGVMRLGASKAALFMNLTPLFTALISMAFLHESLHIYHIIGGSASVIGVLLAQKLTTPLSKKSANK